MTYIYAGFLSYAHADEAVASRLHRALETYKVPKGNGGSLSPIFRDTTELTAHHSLSEKIQGAVEGSRVLIVLCSPAAKMSHWVNEEIRLFRQVHGEASILCVLAEGTPETAFPPALLDGGREPLAANLGETKTSFRLGVTQIAAAMLGVGLDTLMQRDTRRKRRRLQAVTAGAIAFSTAMIFTTYSAVTARKTADLNRQQAEGLVEYMITDMKEKLEPVGRLDILDGIGERAVEYYDAQDIAILSDDSLARQARALHILGQVALDMRKLEKARREIESATRITKEIFDRNPNAEDAIFGHAQSEFWLAEIYKYQRNYAAAATHYKEYAAFSAKLYQIDPMNYDWVMEKAWGVNNVGYVNYRLENYELAEKYYSEAVLIFERAMEIQPENLSTKIEIANALCGLELTKTKLGLKEEATVFRDRQIEIYDRALKQGPSNFSIKFSRAQALSRLVTDGSLDLDSDKFTKTVQNLSDEYEALIAYDPDNLSWKRDYHLYLKALMLRLEYARVPDSLIKKYKRRVTELQDDIAAR